MRRCLTLAVLFAALMSASPVEAGWLSKIIGAADNAGSRAVRHGTGSLDNVAAHIKALPHKPDSHALAVGATPEGHWRFTNRAGETITAASPEELRRALAIVAPEAAGAEGKLALYLAEDTVFRHRSLLKDLPKDATLHLLVDRRAYRLVRQPAGNSERLFAEVRPNVLAEMTEPKVFTETIYQLTRPLDRSRMRAIALDPGNPAAIPRYPNIDAATGRAALDVVDPANLVRGMSSLGGQTAVVTGRLDGDLLYFRPASGGERSLIVRDLIAASEAADVNLVILRSQSARQPVGRNWLWQRHEVRGLDSAMVRTDVSDFLDALGERIAVSANPIDANRTRLVATRMTDLSSGPVPTSITDAMVDVVSDLAGRILTSGVEANVRSQERQRELDDRIVPGIPSSIQFGYLALFVFGLFGLPVSRGWWTRVWPAEQRAEYGSVPGYWAARAVRGLVLILLFAPIVAIASVPVQAVRSIWNTALSVWNILTWPVRRLLRAADA
jgi:hypothetical protein